jgi:ketosteroid isomerase-like protein
MTPSINDPDVVAEISALHEEYERALITNDVETLTRFFWNSPLALRFGVRENLYGADEIEAFRKARPPLGLDRKMINVQIVTFGSDCAVVTLEFLRQQHHGRQSQVWRKFEEGWKIVSAHVSFMYQTYPEQAAAFIDLPIPAGNTNAVAQNVQRAAMIAAPVLEFQLDDDIQGAPRFEP